MRKIFYAILLTLALASAFAAQTRRGTRTGARPRPSTGAATGPTPRPTPAATRTQATGARQTASPAAAAGAQAEDCGCEAGPLPDVLATVNGIKITQADLSPEVQQQIAAYQQQIVEARKAALDAQISNILVEAEAKKRGVATDRSEERRVGKECR